MTQFDERERAFENKFAHDQEMQFKVTVRRNKLLGLWAAEKLGLRAGEADNYAKEVIKSDFEEVGDEDVIRKLVADFAEKAVDVSDQEIRETLAAKASEAKIQIMGEIS